MFVRSFSTKVSQVLKRRPRTSSKPRRRSGVQREVLGLYKNILTVAKSKNEQTFNQVRKKFRLDASSVSRFEFQKIEHLIRKGNKYIKLLSSDTVQGVKG